jgi:capsular polysaccharide export protein
LLSGFWATKTCGSHGDGLCQLKQKKYFSQLANHKNLALQNLLVHKSVLLLQGPVGPLFGKLAKSLQAKGLAVNKVCFNAGDAFDWRFALDTGVHHFRRPVSEWPAYFESLLSSQAVTAVLLFGQARRYHREAISLARASGIKVFVMEEGYFRPGYVTLEANGVNAYSTAMIDAIDLLPMAPTMAKPMPETVAWHFTKMAWAATQHYVAMSLGRRRYPYYQHHRHTSPFGYAVYWLRSWVRKAIRWHVDHTVVRRLVHQASPYFFVPLQSPEDSQIRLHSRFENIESFIDEIIESFAAHADQKVQLLFKQHPMARGGALFADHIRRVARARGVASRVHFVTEAHNPTVLDHCQGVVLINSTLGLQALARLVPVKALGETFYDLPGLTNQQCLDTFWQQPQRPGSHTRDWLSLLKCRTQIPCSLYALSSEPWKALG